MRETKNLSFVAHVGSKLHWRFGTQSGGSGYHIGRQRLVVILVRHLQQLLVFSGPGAQLYVML